MGKVEPGVCDLLTSVTAPDRSVAVGSSQVTGKPVTPTSTTRPISLGQLRMVGGVVSTERGKRIVTL